MAQQNKKGRYSNGSARRALRARIKAEGRPCAICGRPIDYSLPARHPMSYELDEIIPFSRGGSPIDYNNVQATHRMCNNAKSNKVYAGKALEQALKNGDIKREKNGRFAKVNKVVAVSDW